MDEISTMAERIRAYAAEETQTNADMHGVWNKQVQLRPLPDVKSGVEVHVQNAAPLDSEICVLLHPFKRQKNGASPIHRHTYFEMGYVFQGEGVSVVNGVETHLSQGDLFLVSPEALHQMKTFSEEDYVFNVIIQKRLLDDHFLCLISEYNLFTRFFVASILKQSPENCLIFRSGQEGEFTFYIYKIICEALLSENYDQNYLRLLLACLFRELSRLHQRTMEEKSKQENEGLSISRVLQYLTEHYPNATIQSVAGHFHYSARYISSFIARYTGSSFGHILREIKLQNAKRLLMQTNLSCEEIARAVGYNGRDYLDRLFKQRYGKTMSEQRKI